VKGKSEERVQSGKKTNGYTYFCSMNRASVKEEKRVRQWKELDENESKEAV
jgi:hypothetical protein